MLYYFNKTLYIQAENMSLSCLSFPHAVVKGLWHTIHVFKTSYPFYTFTMFSDLNYGSKVQRKIWLDLEHFVISGFC